MQFRFARQAVNDGPIGEGRAIFPQCALNLLGDDDAGFVMLFLLR